MIVKKLALAGLLMSVPAFAFADPIAASLGASFGSGLDAASIDVPDGEILLVAPTSVSVSAASGDRVTASAVATKDSSGALAAATTLESNIFASVAYNSDANAYESFVEFGPSNDELEAALGELIAEVESLGGDLKALEDLVATLPTCDTVVSVEGTGSSVTPVRQLLVTGVLYRPGSVSAALPAIELPGEVSITGSGTLCNDEA